MNGLQKKILEILLDTHEALDKNGVTHFLGYGTAIGAVRDKGFIPWDDDADMLIFRKDLSRFVEALKDLPSEKYHIQYPDDGDCQLSFFKIRMNNTTYLEDYCMHLPIHHGIFIDVFVIEDFPSGAVAGKIYRALGWLYGKLPWTYFRSRWKIKKAVVKYLRKTLFRLMDIIGTRDGDTVLTTVRTSDILKNIMPRAFYGEPVLVPFEGHMLPVPEKWDEYLSFRYGDYMTPHTEKERILHGIVTCDLDKGIDLEE